jgi:hypothetical protein
MLAHTRCITQLHKRADKGALYSAYGLRLVAADAGNQNQTMKDELASLVTPPTGGPMPRPRARPNLNGLARSTSTGSRNPTP